MRSISWRRSSRRSFASWRGASSPASSPETAGRPPSSSTNRTDTLYAVLREPVPSLHEEPTTASGMSAIVDRLLDKAPHARFQSAADSCLGARTDGCRRHRHAATGPIAAGAAPMEIAGGHRGRRPDSGCGVAAPLVIAGVGRDRGFRDTRHRTVHVAAAGRDAPRFSPGRVPKRPPHCLRRCDRFPQMNCGSGISRLSTPGRFQARLVRSSRSGHRIAGRSGSFPIASCFG